MPLNRIRRIFAVGVLPLALQACGCDTSGCVDGLNVKFASAPSSPWTVELLVNGVLPKASFATSCDGTRECPSGASFDTDVRDGLSVRITTSTGVRTTSLPRINYARPSSSNNWCEECRGSAEVTVPVP
jgi:hypothetical protein